MDTSNLAEQVEKSIDQLHDLFDEIGVPTNERQARESELFTALSDALNKYLRLVTTEKKDMIEEAKKIVIAIRQMETSLEDPKHAAVEHPEFRIGYPLMRTLQVLREKHAHMARLHKERYDQVMKLAEALQSYSSHLEPTFVQITLPPTGSNRSIPLTFDLSPSYVDRLDSEFTRVYEEYTRRLAAVQALGEHIIQLWVELGVPQAQQDAGIVKYYRDAPEQLGLHEEDIKRLTLMRDELSEEKKSREKRLNTLKATVESLWEKLGIDEEETKMFLNQNRGCGIRQINEFEDELERLNELKRQNLQYFVEDARMTLQELWDTLYFSEDEMLEFTPAFSDVYSDALLEAHEREIKRLVALREQRAPTLNLVAKHKGLIKDRDELIAASQDSSRLMLRGQKGEKRDPGKLLREEKMRKRIAKELPRVTVEVTTALEQWEEEYGRPFLVHGNRYLNEMDQQVEDTFKRPGTSRSKTPAMPASTIKVPGSAPPRANAYHPKSVPSRNMSKTPSANEGATKKPQSQQGQSPGRGVKCTGSPSKLTARVPLSNLKNGANSPDRPKQSKQQQQQHQQQPPVEKLRNGAPARAPPPKMRALKPVPELDAPVDSYKSATGLDSNIVRALEPEDVYDDRLGSVRSLHSHNTNLSRHKQSGSQYDGSSYEDYYSSLRLLPPPSHVPLAAPTRQVSSTSTSTTLISGSENWETYDDNSEPEVDVSSTYYSKLRAVRGKRLEPEHGHQPPSSPAKRVRGIPAGYTPPVMIDEEGNRIISGSEWADDDTF